MVDEYKNRARLRAFVDKRIGQGNDNMSQEDKMKLRFIREQRDQLKGKSVSVTRRKAKFNLENDSDDDELDFLTHKGKRLNLQTLDDFKDNVSHSDDDAYSDKDMARGIMPSEIVKADHFGGGTLSNNLENAKKTREERYTEIMQKQKAYKFHKQEIKEATIDATKQLDEDLKGLSSLI